MLNDPFETLSYTQSELKGVMRVCYDRIIDFVTSKPFRSVLADFSETPHLDRPRFVAEVLLNPEELRSRGVSVPDGLLIQRSAFGDRRPTLFVIKHFLPEQYRDVWENVNITFDNEYLDHEVSREIEDCWREPLNPLLQAKSMSRGADLEKV